MNTYKAIKNGILSTTRSVAPPAGEPLTRRQEVILKEVELDRARMERMDDQIVKLRRKIEYSEFSAVEDPLATFYDGDQYMADVADLPWLLEGFIPLGYLAVLGGSSKSGKSCFATALAISVANGEPFLGMATKGGPVLWFACEESVEERQAALRAWPAVPKNLKTTHHRIRIDGWRDLRDLRSCIERTGAALVVIDSLFAATGAALADGRSARDALMGLKDLAAETLCTVLVIHHINKESGSGLHRDRFAESNQILATASMDILFDSTLRDGHRDIRLSCRGRGDWANRELLLRSDSVSEYERIGDGRANASMAEVRFDAIRSALATISEPLTAEELADLCNAPLGSTRNCLTRMVKEGAIRPAGKKGRAALFELIQPAQRSSPPIDPPMG